MALRELLDKNELQRLQDGFCRIAGISAYCLDHDGSKITRISGDDRYLHCLQERLALERVQGDGSIEDLAIEDIEGKKQVAALSVQARGEKELYWVAFKPENMEEAAFYQAVELLRDASITFLQGKLQSYGAQANQIRSEAEARKMGRNLKMIQAMGKIVHLLESVDSIEIVMREWLEAVSRFLELDTAQIFKLQEDQKFMDVICEWLEKGENSLFERTARVPAYSFLKKREHFIVNADTVADPEFHEIFQLGVKSAMIYPIGPKEGGMVIALNHRRAQVFDEEAEQFASDAVKILDSILIRRIQKNSLTGAYASVEAVLNGISACIMVRDEARRRMIYANQSFKNYFGEELKEDRFDWLLEAASRDADEDRSEDDVFSERREIYYEGKDRWYDLTVTDVRWMDGNLYRMYSLFEVTEKKNYQAQIAQQEYVDFLTGLYNRLRCERDLETQVEAAIRQRGTGCVLYLDLDDFKRVNDGLGHQYGDVLLKAIAHEFQRIPGMKEHCYRYGGDEFVIIVPPEEYDDLDAIMEDVQEIFNKPWFLKDSDYYCTMSMGVVTYPDKGTVVTDLLQKADEAMLTAKKAGKDCYHFYNDDSIG